MEIQLPTGRRRAVAAAARARQRAGVIRGEANAGKNEDVQRRGGLDGEQLGGTRPGRRATRMLSVRAVNDVEAPGAANSALGNWEAREPGWSAMGRRDGLRRKQEEDAAARVDMTTRGDAAEGHWATRRQRSARSRGLEVLGKKTRS